jgi:hypothetical protein
MTDSADYDYWNSSFIMNKDDKFTRRNKYRKRLIHERTNWHSSRSPKHVIYIDPNYKIKKDNVFNNGEIYNPIIHYPIHEYLTRLLF